MKFNRKKKEPVLVIVNRLEERRELSSFYKSYYKKQLYIEDIKNNKKLLYTILNRKK